MLCTDFPFLVITRAVKFTQAIGEQHLCSDDLEAKASALPGQQLHESVQTFGISGGVAISKVIEYRLPIVLNCHCQRQKAIVVIRGDLFKPSKVALQGYLFGFCLIDLVKRFFEAVSDFQLWKVFEPCFNNELLAFIEVMSPTQKQVLIVHQASSGLIRQALAHSPADMFQATRKQLEDVEFVYHQVSMRQDLAYCIMVASPHISAYNDNLLFRLIRQSLQVTDNSSLLSVFEQIYDAMVVDIRDDTAILVEQVQLIDPQIKQIGIWKARLNISGELTKQGTDQLLINSYIIGNTSEGSAQCGLANVIDQALCHEMMLVHVGQALEEGLAASTTTIPFALNADPDPLVPDGYVHVRLRLYFVSVQLGVPTMSTTRWQNDTFCLNVKVVFILIYSNDAVVCQSKDIQEMRSLPDVLPHEFQSCREIPVTGERRLLRVSYSDSTHFSESGLLCRGRQNRGIPRTNPISPK